MSVMRVVVSSNGRLPDPRAHGVLRAAASLGVAGVERVEVADVYFLRGALALEALERLCQNLLCDTVTEVYTWAPVETAQADTGVHVIEVGFLPGVTDTVAEQLLHGARVLGVLELDRAAVVTRYTLEGALGARALHTLAQGALCNEVIQRYALGPIMPQFVDTLPAVPAPECIPLRELDAPALLALSRARRLSLDQAEMEAVQAYFRTAGRDPTDVELETLAQTWSEHCVHKTFKAHIACANGSDVDGLLRTYIRAATESLARPWVRSAFVDNAGIIDFDDRYEVSFKVETHNHPSALEPFGGANTGVGGVVRDVLGVSHRPIATTDVLCFGPQDTAPEQVPAGTLHPARVAAGVVAGVQDYGNKLGLPTVNGAILYDPGYIANPLVFCGCVGLAPKQARGATAQPGDRIIALGGRTGRDGLRGATFSSDVLTHETGAIASTAVQIGNPIVEKCVLEVIVRARDAGWYRAITDCGAGGFSSAVGEMGADVGVDVELASAPLKYPGLAPWEIWLSEAQERMVLAVPPEHVAALEGLCAAFEVELCDLGVFTGEGRLIVRHSGVVVADLSMDFLHHGIPRRFMQTDLALATPPRQVLPEVRDEDYGATLLALLKHPNIASKESVIRLYDHEVQGATVIKPLAGLYMDGPSDGAVLKPLVTEGHTGLALACGINPAYGALDPYAMAVACLDEAMRNIVAVGADPTRVAVLDNFCWGNPQLPDRLASLVRAAQGCYDAALLYETPFISGKDSLNNEYTGQDGTRHSIPPTLLISAIGIVPDVRHALTLDFKSSGHLVYALGYTREELGGSHYALVHGLVGGVPPALAAHGPMLMRALHGAMANGLVQACHDCSEGGLAVALAEMAFAGRLGVAVDVAGLPIAGEAASLRARLFAESNARFLVAVEPDDVVSFEAMLADTPFARIGVVTAQPEIRIEDAGRVVVTLSLEVLGRAWKGVESA